MLNVIDDTEPDPNCDESQLNHLAAAVEAAQPPSRPRRKDRRFFFALFAAGSVHAAALGLVVHHHLRLPQISIQSGGTAGSSDSSFAVEIKPSASSALRSRFLVSTKPPPINPLDPAELARLADADDGGSFLQTLKLKPFDPGPIEPGPAAAFVPQAMKMPMMSSVPGTDNTVAPPSTGRRGVASPVPNAGNQPPEYPTEALRQHLQGTVILKVSIADDGSVARVTLATSSGHELLDTAALAAVRHWRFAAESACEVQLPVRFILKQ